MKKTIAMVLVLLIAMGCGFAASASMLSDIQASGKLIVGAEVSFPPYEFYYTDPVTGEETLQGFDMMLAMGLAKELGVEFVLADQEFSGLITALRGGEINVIISGLSIKPDRLEVVDFSDPYYGGGKQTVLVAKADVDMYKTPADFDGKVIGAQTGSLQQGCAEEQFAGAELMLLSKVPLLVQELLMGSVQGVILTENVAQSYVTLYPDQVMISETPVLYESPGVGVAITKADDNESFIEFVNAYIAKVQMDGTFDTWVEEAVALNESLVAKE